MAELFFSLFSFLFPSASPPQTSSMDGSSKDAAYFDVEMGAEIVR